MGGIMKKETAAFFAVLSVIAVLAGSSVVTSTPKVNLTDIDQHINETVIVEFTPTDVRYTVTTENRSQSYEVYESGALDPKVMIPTGLERLEVNKTYILQGKVGHIWSHNYPVLYVHKIL